MSDILLQILIGVQIFIVGVLAVVAWQHGREHFKPPKPAEPVNPQPQLPAVQLPADMKERLTKASESQFEAALKQGAQKFHEDLGVTSGHINNLVMRLATEIVSGELERYRAELAKLHKQAETNMGGIRSEVAKHQSEIEAKITAELEAEKQRLVKQIDTKLADAVGSFLTETLQHNVDLGGQNQYLLDMLEEHKADFVKEVGDDSH